MNLQPGDIVNLILRWGTQRRLKCPECYCFIRGGATTDELVVCACGATYQPKEQGFEVVTIRGG